MGVDKITSLERYEQRRAAEQQQAVEQKRAGILKTIGHISIGAGAALAVILAIGTPIAWMMCKDRTKGNGNPVPSQKKDTSTILQQQEKSKASDFTIHGAETREMRVDWIDDVYKERSSNFIDNGSGEKPRGFPGRSRLEVEGLPTKPR